MYKHGEREGKNGRERERQYAHIQAYITSVRNNNNTIYSIEDSISYNVRGNMMAYSKINKNMRNIFCMQQQTIERKYFLLNQYFGKRQKINTVLGYSHGRKEFTRNL